MKPMFRIPLVALCVLVIGCSGNETEAESATATDETTCLSDTMMELIKLDEVEEGESRRMLTLTGEVMADPDRMYRVYAAAGGVVENVRVQRGEAVRRGQTLMEVRSPEIAAFRKDEAAARAQVRLAERQLDLTRSMVESGVVGQRELIEAELAVEQSQIDLEQIRQRAAVLGIREDDSTGSGLYRLTAPQSGFVLERHAHAGMLLRDEDESVFTLADLSHVHIVANIFERDIRWVREGAAVEISTLAYPDTVFTGRVTRVSQVLHPDKRVAEAIIAIPNSENLLKPGMFAGIRIERNGGERSMRVPQAALIFDNNAHHVVVFRDACDVEVRTVSIADRFNDTVFLSDGVESGETVVSNKQLLIFNQLMY
ncbi:MAG: efflux RND transporter periplasmic adaptor subunit [Balneolales bacterium]|nr:efflux RND transporter periplasmic adaptor subunit [Balneolales bacterium]